MQLILLQMRDKLAIQQWRSIISAGRGVFLIKLEKLVASTFKSEPRITPRAKSQISIRFQYFFLFEHPKISKKPGLSLPSETAWFFTHEHKTWTESMYV
ncbi:hypothetical protein Peur_036339 [Populus x canadensis]